MIYRKDTVVIEAIQWSGHENIKAIEKWLGDKLISEQREGCAVVGYWVKTLNGNVMISYGDYIVKDVHGEFSLCKSDVFENAYEKIEA